MWTMRYKVCLLSSSHICGQGSCSTCSSRLQRCNSYQLKQSRCASGKQIQISACTLGLHNAEFMGAPYANEVGCMWQQLQYQLAQRSQTSRHP